MASRRRLAAAVLAPALLAALAFSGCGGAEGVADGATVRVYVVPPLCGGAERALAAAGSRAGDLEVRAVCLPPEEGAALGATRLKLATVGANARRATEDSSAVAYLEKPGRANRFAEPIVEEADLAYLAADSGVVAMERVLRAVEEAGSDSLRADVRSALAGS